MKATQVTPEQMTVICNIQMMWDKIGFEHNTKDFNNLCLLSYDELHDKQNSLIEAYNKHLR